jgi:8-oxo-dGTP pyrophosphatase MutT (NUDIX family)
MASQKPVPRKGFDDPPALAHFHCGRRRGGLRAPPSSRVHPRTLPIDREGFTYLVGQYRFGAHYYSWELPAGGADPDEDLRAAAKRELREETGLLAESWLPLLEIIPSGSITDEKETCFVAWGFDKVERDLDPQEVIRLRRVPFDEALRMAITGEIRDAGSVAALCALRVRVLQSDLPDELAQRLK